MQHDCRLGAPLRLDHTSIFLHDLTAGCRHSPPGPEGGGGDGLVVGGGGGLGGSGADWLISGAVCHLTSVCVQGPMRRTTRSCVMNSSFFIIYLLVVSRSTTTRERLELNLKNGHQPRATLPSDTNHRDPGCWLSLPASSPASEGPANTAPGAARFACGQSPEWPHNPTGAARPSFSFGSSTFRAHQSRGQGLAPPKQKPAGRRARRDAPTSPCVMPVSTTRPSAATATRTTHFPA